MPDRAAAPVQTLQRITKLVAEVLAQNKALRAEVDDLQDHIEGLTTKLTAAKAATHTLNQEAETRSDTLRAEAERDTEQRLVRLRTELDAYLNEVDRRLESSSAHAQRAT